eukprot:2703974-Amphidinium_carterae.4
MCGHKGRSKQSQFYRVSLIVIVLREKERMRLKVPLEDELLMKFERLPPTTAQPAAQLLGLADQMQADCHDTSLSSRQP